MTVMHIDANSAFLSWTAAAALESGAEVDLRTIPSVVGGDEAARHGIVLAKSQPAKKYGITTGESLMEARRKCPGLVVAPPDFDLYTKCSNAMYSLLCEYSPVIERYSIDECFLDYTGSEEKFGDPVKTAYEIKERIKKELGFTVNIGVSVNRILAKMGSELQKPDRVHTLYPDEIAEKMWPLPVGDLFMVGRRSVSKLLSLNIKTIGDLAHADRKLLRSVFKSHGDLMWEYANGIDSEPVVPRGDVPQKGVGNSMTIDHDVYDREEACKYILSLCESVGTRLRRMDAKANVISVSVKTSDFIYYSHQRRLERASDVTMELYKAAISLFDASWHGEHIRQLGIATSDLQYEDIEQLSLFDAENNENARNVEKTMDEIRNRFGKDAIKRATFVGDRSKEKEEHNFPRF